MEIDIIRIYRRSDADSRLIASIVEEPGEPQAKAFANIDELLDILSRKVSCLKHERRHGGTA